MPTYLSPGVYVEEVSMGPRPIQPTGTSTAGFVGQAPDAKARVNEAVAVNNWTQFVNLFVPKGSASTPLSHAVYGFFANGGRRCFVVNCKDIAGGGTSRAGLDVLKEIDEVAIVAAPGLADAASYAAVLDHCSGMKDRFAILDCPETVPRLDLLTQVAVVSSRKKKPEDTDAGSDSDGGMRPPASPWGAVYFPRVTVRDPLPPNDFVDVAPSGHLAGIYARTDATRGVHKAPANERIRGALNVTYRLTRDEQGELNQHGINCIRLFPRDGILVWGARTLAEKGSEWTYVNVRRLFTMVEESIANSTRWIVFEPNEEALWKKIRRDVSAFLSNLWRDGALMGRSPEEAFFVKCDEETNPPESIDAGRVVILIGMAPVKPAEFIVFRIGQSAAGAEIETE